MKHRLLRCSKKYEIVLILYVNQSHVLMNLSRGVLLPIHRIAYLTNNENDTLYPLVDSIKWHCTTYLLFTWTH